MAGLLQKSIDEVIQQIWSTGVCRTHLTFNAQKRFSKQKWLSNFSHVFQQMPK
jgi:hypothetical protein